MESTTTTPVTTTPSTEAATVTPKLTVAQQIDRMVSRTAAPNPVTVKETSANDALIYNSATKQVTTADGRPAPTDDAPITGTSAREQQMVFDKIGTEYQRVVSKLEDHYFTPTGEKVYTVPVGSDARRVLLLQAHQQQSAGQAIQATIAKLTVQEAAAGQSEAQQNAVRQARRAFSGGDPRRAEIFNEALARAEAEEAARLVLASRAR